jgi:hypothetical protein
LVIERGRGSGLKLKELLKEQLATLKAVVKLTTQDYFTGRSSLRFVKLTRWAER